MRRRQWRRRPAPTEAKALWAALLAGQAAGRPAGELAWQFHHDLAAYLAHQTAPWLTPGATVLLTGGCLQNGLFARRLVAALRRLGARPFVPSLVPVNDGGLALGQAVIGWARQQADGRVGEGL